MPPLPFLLLALHSRTRTILIGSRLPPAMKRKRPIAARTRRAAAALSTVQPVASDGGDASPFSSFHFTRERRPEPVPMCVSCGGGARGTPPLGVAPFTGTSITPAS